MLERYDQRGWGYDQIEHCLSVDWERYDRKRQRNDQAEQYIPHYNLIKQIEVDQVIAIRL